MRAARSALVVPLVVALAALASCDDATEADEGTDAYLRVKDGQFFRGAMPAEEHGPLLKSVTVSPIVHPGSTARTASGEMDPNATAVALTIDGDKGYWILPAGIPSVAARGFPTFAAEIAFAKSLGIGRKTFVARAVDAQGNFGVAFTRPLDVMPDAAPSGHLVITLGWDNQADLDLHVVDPRGVEIWKRNINSYEPPPPGASPEPPNTPHPGGILDFDSNAECIADGRRAESVVYKEKPPSGHYVVRVDTSSLCGEVSAHWRVEGFIDGVSVGAAQGASTEFDTRYTHDRGAGVLALELDVP